MVGKFHDSSSVPEEVKKGVLLHHERADGSGYPFNTKAKDINFFARIVSVADVFDAMTSDRVYKKRSSLSMLLKCLKRWALMESILKRKGYKYIAAYNGKEALDVLKNNKVDLILMDVQMPELNGFETAKIIREGEVNERNIPIVALTAYAMIDDKEKCIRAGMDDYIAKPFNIEKLYEVIGLYLGK